MSQIFNRNQFNRLVVIHNSLQGGGTFSGEELRAIVNKKLNLDEKTVSKRTFIDDIKMLRDVFHAPIPERKYCYTAPYSFLDVLGVNDRILLSELRGLVKKVAGFSFIDKVLKDEFIQLAIRLDVFGKNEKIVHFDTNEQLMGVELLQPLFVWIQQKQVLTINYGPFDKPAADYIVHPYLLKEYNNRWYLYGLDHFDKKIKQWALDRLRKVEPKRYISYIENTQLNPDEYFSDMVGINKKLGDVREKVVVRVYDSSINYVVTKPIHDTSNQVNEGTVIRKGVISGKTNEEEIEFVDFEYDLIINYEFKSKILALGANAEVLEPSALREQLRSDVMLMSEMYSK